ncbi:9279_t:CDS:1, partial [Racocetra persica]
TKAKKTRRLDRKRKAVTKWYKENPNSIIEASISTSAISIPIITIAATSVVASTSIPILTTIFVTISTPTFAIPPAVTTTTTLATILTTISAPILTTNSIIISPTTTPSPASLELVSISALGGLQSFISTTLSIVFTESTTLESTNLQQKE